MRRTIASLSFGLILLITPLFVSADAVSDLQAQIQALLTQLSALQNQNAGSSTGFTPTTPSSVTPESDDTPTVPTAVSCPRLSITMQRGSRDAATGGQVSALQIFLAQQFNLNDDDVVTGYFGASTERYVKAFQTQYGLPAYGIAGSLTRVKIMQVCGGGAVPTSPPQIPSTTTPVPVATNPITVTAPNGGERWEIGTMNSITWKPYDPNLGINGSNDVTAYLEGKGGAGGKIVPSGKASIHWEGQIVHTSNGVTGFAEPGEYYIRIVNNKTGASDRSDFPFTMLARSVDLKINGSDGPITVDISKPVVATWNAVGATSCQMHNAYPDTTRQTQVGNVPTSGSKEVYLHAFGPTLYCYRADGKAVYDSVQISTNATGNASNLKVVSPNGGEKFNISQPLLINWQATNLNSLSIALYRNDQWQEWIAKDLSAGFVGNTNQYSWTPSSPGLAEFGSVFKIYVTGQKSDGTGYIDDKSDAPFGFTTTATTQTNPVIISSFSAYPATVTPGQSTVFSWASNLSSTDINTYSGFCAIEGRPTSGSATFSVPLPKQASGSVSYTPRETANYFLVCTSGGKDGSPIAKREVSVTVAATSPNRNPIGYLDVVNHTSFAGWTCDPDDFSKIIDVHFYVDGSAGSGTFAGFGSAWQAREAAVGALCGGNSSHGFNVPVSTFSAPVRALLLDGRTHTIHAYAINHPIGTNPLLGTLTLAASAVTPAVVPSTVNLSGTPIDGGVTSPLAANATAVKLADFTLTAGASEDVRMKTWKFTIRNVGSSATVATQLTVTTADLGGKEYPVQQLTSGLYSTYQVTLGAGQDFAKNTPTQVKIYGNTGASTGGTIDLWTYPNEMTFMGVSSGQTITPTSSVTNRGDHLYWSGYLSVPSTSAAPAYSQASYGGEGGGDGGGGWSDGGGGASSKNPYANVASSISAYQQLVGILQQMISLLSR